MNAFLVFAQSGADSPVNQWLNKNPAVLGLIAIAIGLALAGSGIYELRKGVARDKYGNEMTGGTAKFMSMFRLVFGIAACGFGLYKMILG